jgi:hypothetical protein
MRCLALVVAGALLSAAARAEPPDPPPSPPPPAPVTLTPTPLPNPTFVRMLVGLGSAPNLPKDDNAPNTVMTAELGGHPFRGALETGFSFSSANDLKGYWSVVTPGIFAALDLTYVFATGFWTYQLPGPNPTPTCSLAATRRSGLPCFRLRLGGRLGLSLSSSSRPDDVPYASTYQLVRPELQPFLDVEVPVSTDRFSLVLRGAFDSPVNLSTLFRWNVTAGLSYAYDKWGKSP